MKTNWRRWVRSLKSTWSMFQLWIPRAFKQCFGLWWHTFLPNFVWHIKCHNTHTSEYNGCWLYLCTPSIIILIASKPVIMIYLQALWGRLYSSKSTKEMSTMYHLRNLIARNVVLHDSEKNMNAAEDFTPLLLHTHAIMWLLLREFFSLRIQPTSRKQTGHKFFSKAMIKRTAISVLSQFRSCVWSKNKIRPFLKSEFCQNFVWWEFQLFCVLLYRME